VVPVLLAVAVIGALMLVDGGDDDPEPLRPSPTTTTTVERFIPRGITAYSPRGLDDVVVLGAPVGHESMGSLAAIDVATGYVTRRDRQVRLWPGDFEFPLVVVGDVLVWSDLSVARAVTLHLRDDPVVIGAAGDIRPSIDADRVWLARGDRWVRAGADGVVDHEVMMPAGCRFEAEVAEGALLGCDRDLVVVDPATGDVRVRHHDVGPIWAASPTHVLLDQADLLDLVTGAVEPLPGFGLDTGAELVVAAFSPDGSHLALFSNRPRTREVGVAMVEVGPACGQGCRHHFHQLLSVGTPVRSRLAWSRDGDVLYLLAGPTSDAADRVIGIPVDGSAQLVATLDRYGWWWLAVG